MSLDLDTHGQDWRQHLRDNDVFACLVDTGTATDALQLAQYAYAKQLGKPIYLLVLPGAYVPRVMAQEPHRYFIQDPEDAVRLLKEIIEGER